MPDDVMSEREFLTGEVPGDIRGLREHTEAAEEWAHRQERKWT